MTENTDIEDEIEELIMSLYQHGKNEVRLDIYKPRATQAILNILSAREKEARVDELSLLNEELLVVPHAATKEMWRAVPMAYVENRIAQLTAPTEKSDK